ncbi:MAG: tannase/feruloyl esterase family alpha/beta hydrolase [Myxococcota bacterium]
MAESEKLPAYCRVRGVIQPAIHFELRMPLEGWNDKLYMAGCGGLCGRLEADEPTHSNGINVALQQSYAAVATDAGHRGAHEADGAWALDSRDAERDWAWRAIPEVVRVSQALVGRYYDRPPTRSYFSGCSNGGRMGALAAQRLPELFDGVIVGCPALDWATLAMHGAWLVQANTDADGAPIVDTAAARLVANAVLSLCDGADGLEDGQIDDPRRCNFDPAILRCAATGEDGGCLTDTQIETLHSWYGGLPGGSDRGWSYALPFGSEPYWSFWWIPSGSWWSPWNRWPGAGLVYLENLFGYVLFEEDPGPDYSIQDFDLATDPPALEFMRELYRADDPDLSRFRADGGKAILYQGWSDPAAVPGAILAYYDEVRSQAGGQDEIDEFLRLFMIPGSGHCFEPPNESTEWFDPLSALDEWVERGTAPDRLVAERHDPAGRTTRTRPLCPYPKAARYRGSGSVDDAGSFDCVFLEDDDIERAARRPRP